MLGCLINQTTVFADVNNKSWIEVVVPAGLETLARAPMLGVGVDERNRATGADDAADFRERSGESPLPPPLQRRPMTGIKREEQFEVLAIVQRGRETAAGRGRNWDSVCINLEADPQPARLDAPTKVTR
jgi:hypothetical protein